MPKKEASIVVAGMDKDRMLAVCFSSFQELNWEIKFAGEDKLIAYTPKKWNTKPQQIVAAAGNGQLTVSSEMTGDEMVDLGGKNQKNIDTFLAAFDTAKTALPAAQQEQNIQAIHALRIETARAAAEHQTQMAEVDQALNISGSNLYATYAIIGLNVIVFILMVMDGAGIMEPNGLVHLKWGSNFGPLTLSGDWWRLFTNVFIHFGLIHLAMNMYSLYMAGVYLEPLLGKTRYVAAYLCTGVLASITSLWWHSTPVNSAGASGAIFGMYGLFLAFLTTNLIPELVRKSLLPSIGIFVAYNLAYGMKGGVDNAAHVGGLISGFIIGYLFVLGIKREKQEQNAAWVLPLVLLATAVITVEYLQQHRAALADRHQLINEIKDISFKDNDKFTNSLKEFGALEDKAMAPLRDTSISDVVRNNQLQEISLPEWEKAKTIVTQMQSYDVSETLHKKANLFLEYIEIRKQQIVAFDEIISGKKNAPGMKAIDSSLVAVMQKLKDL